MGLVHAARRYLIALAITRKPLQPDFSDSCIAVSKPSTVGRRPDKRDICAQRIQLRRTRAHMECDSEKRLPQRSDDSVVRHPCESLKESFGHENKFRWARQVR